MGIRSFFDCHGVVFIVCYGDCGINYRPGFLLEEEGLITKEYSTEELREVCEWLTEELNLRADKVERDQDGVMILEEQSEKRAVQAMKSLVRTVRFAGRILSAAEEIGCF